MYKRSSLLSILPALAFCIIMIAGCVATRLNDEQAKTAFDKAGVPLRFSTYVASGRTLHYAMTGEESKPTLFFIHGSPATWYCFENYMQDKELLRSFRIISIDRPGFGGSDNGDAMSVCDQATLIAPLVAQLQNGKPFYVVGHSLGGPLAAKLAALCPDKVSGLVLLAASVDPDEERPEVWRQLIMAGPVSNFVPVPLQTCNREIAAFKEDVYTLASDLHRISCPVTIVQGLADHMVTPGNGNYARQQLINAASVRLVLIENGHHNIPWTHYAEVKHELLAMSAHL